MLYFNSFSKSDEAIGCFIAQIFVFKDEECLGWDCFFNETVTVGSSHKADIRIDDINIADIHAIIYFTEDQILIVSQSPEFPILVNGEAFESCVLQSLDFIEIGSYTLKIKTIRISEKSQSMEQIKGADKARGINANLPKTKKTSESENLWRNWVEEDD